MLLYKSVKYALPSFNLGKYQHSPPPRVEPWSGISGGPMGQFWGGSSRPVISKHLDLAFGSPIRNLAGTPMGQ